MNMWRWRWIVLRDTYIAYFKTAFDTTPLGYLQIDTGLAISRVGRLITILTHTRKLSMMAPTMVDANDWHNALNSFYAAARRRNPQVFECRYQFQLFPQCSAE